MNADLQRVIDVLKYQITTFSEMQDGLREEGHDNSPAYYHLAGKINANQNCIRLLESILRKV